VLPRLEWRRCGGRAVLRLVLHSDISLREDAATARAFLASLTTTQATPGGIPPLLSERHSSDYPQWQAMIARATKAIAPVKWIKWCWRGQPTCSLPPRWTP
jgi:menaquinone-specific isochorismate synthase